MVCAHSYAHTDPTHSLHFTHIFTNAVKEQVVSKRCEEPANDKERRVEGGGWWEDPPLSFSNPRSIHVHKRVTIEWNVQNHTHGAWRIRTRFVEMCWSLWQSCRNALEEKHSKKWRHLIDCAQGGQFLKLVESHCAQCSSRSVKTMCLQRSDSTEPTWSAESGLYTNKLDTHTSSGRILEEPLKTK